jgi:hypothetical protein
MTIRNRIFFLISFSISILLLIYTFYRSEIVYNGNSRDTFYFYYIISLVILFISIVILFVNKKLREYLIISTISIFASLYLFELYLTYNSIVYTDISPIVKMRAKKLYSQDGKKYDVRTPYKIYTDLKKIDPEITLRVYPKVFYNEEELYPLSGISNSKTILCNESGYYSHYHSDRFGFNNPDKEWDSSHIEYLLIGDSFTHGSCVNRPNDIASVLRNLSNKSVINLGMGGNGTLIEYASLREYLNTNVSKVLLLFVENDLKNLNKEIKNKILKKYISDEKFTQNLKENQSDINRMVRKKIDSHLPSHQFKSRALGFVKLTNLRVLTYKKKLNSSTSQEQENEVLTEFRKLLLLIKKLTNENNSKFYFIYLPPSFRYNNPKYISNHNLVEKIVKDLDIEFLDMHKEVFAKELDPLKLFPFGLHGHYNVEGYNKVANQIYKLTKK